MKALHRLIVTSSTYRMASTEDAADLKIDPDNRYLWRMNARRMDAEIVRDNLLWAAGRLDLARGGPDIDHNLGMTVKRRSLYFRHAPEKEMEFLRIFDGPNVNECYRRKETVAPQQALALANSPLALAEARFLARELSRSVNQSNSNSPIAGPTSPTGPIRPIGLMRSSSSMGGVPYTAFVTAAFERVLARPPSRAELAECLAFLDEQARRLAAPAPGAATADPKDTSRPAADPALRARENLVLVLFNHNDFVTIR
jgi:hypothetical protein